MGPCDRAGGVPVHTAIRALVHAAGACSGIKAGRGQGVERQGQDTTNARQTSRIPTRTAVRALEHTAAIRPGVEGGPGQGIDREGEDANARQTGRVPTRTAVGALEYTAEHTACAMSSCIEGGRVPR